MASQPLPLGFVPGAAALPLAPFVPQAAAGAAVAAAVLAAPVEIPLLAAAAIGLGIGLAVGLAWDALNSNREASGAEGDYLFKNNTGQVQTAQFRAYTVYNLPPGATEPVALVGKFSELIEANPWINTWADYNWILYSFDLPPGSSGGSLKFHATGSPIPNSRPQYFSATVNGETRNIAINDYRPGQFLGYAILSVPEGIEISDNGATVAKPNTLAPQAFKETEKPKPMAPPLPYLPAFAPDIGTPVTPETTPTTPTDPTKKEDPKAPPDLLPATVPIWQPGPSPSTTPGPAIIPAPARNPQTIPSTNPAKPNVAFDLAGLPIPQVAPAVKPTSTTTHQVGPLTIPAKAPQATLQGIAEEVGRIEQKLEIVLNPGNQAPGIDWMNNLGKIAELLFSATAAGDYELTSGCELDANRQRIIKRAAYGGSIDRIGVLENKIDALAELMQHSKDLKQPACIPPTKPSTVTVTAYQLPPYT